MVYTYNPHFFKGRNMKIGSIVMIVLLIAAGGYFLLNARNSQSVTIEDDMVTLTTGDLECSFILDEELDDTILMFGGAHISMRNVVSPITVSGISVDDALEIHEEHPDFFECNSPGAAQAKQLFEQYSLIPADSSVLSTLKTAIKEFKRTFKNKDPRACVKLKGNLLEIDSIEVPEADADVTSKFKRFNFYLITSAEVSYWDEFTD